jgi:diacylglycerol kinase (ATP)
MKNEAKGLKRLINAGQYSWQGFCAAYKSEEAFRQEVWLAIVLIPLGFFVGDTSIEKLILVSSVLFLMIVELLNSAIEAVVDRFGPEWNQYAGMAKDMGSAAVLLAVIMLLLSWGLIVFV